MPGQAHGARVYLDTTVLSRLTDYYKNQQIALSPDDIQALEAIADDDSLDFKTSEKTLQEILRTSNSDHRILLKFIYRIMSKVPIAPGVLPLPQIKIGGQRSRSISPGNRADPLFLEMSQLFDQDDAEQIFQAAKSECQYFLTTDKSTILKRVNADPTLRARLKRSCPDLEVVSLKDLQDQL